MTLLITLLEPQLLKPQKEYLSLGNRTKVAHEQFKNYSTELARHILERGLVRIRRAALLKTCNKLSPVARLYVFIFWYIKLSMKQALKKIKAQHFLSLLKLRSLT